MLRSGTGRRRGISGLQRSDLDSLRQRPERAPRTTRSRTVEAKRGSRGGGGTPTASQGHDALVKERYWEFGSVEGGWGEKAVVRR